MASSQKTYSRLDQLLTLLENGTTQATRSAAAKQLGVIQKKHPHDLHILLKRLLSYVRHKEWDARVSGAEAIKCVIGEVPPWSATAMSQVTGVETEDETEGSTKLKISNINMNRIMSGAELLLCSSGEEFELKSDGDLAEDLMKARRRIERKMGLTVGGNTNLGLSSNDLFVDDDLKLHHDDGAAKSNMAVTKAYVKGKAPCAEVMAQITEGMSSREKNRVKRKAKMFQKQNSVESPREDEARQAKKKRKLDQQDHLAKTQEPQTPQSDPNKWPFEWICEELLTLLFSPTWEWRHGACLALRDILTVHGSGAGTVLGSSKAKMVSDNNAWLQDAAVRMLCVMVLDRFGDFVSDQMIAPVRESCAQALAVTTKYLRNETVSEILNILVYLTKHEEWEVRHAGYLGIKYTLAVREDLREDNISRCLLPLINGLRDTDGDVRSVSADALSPIVKYLINTKTMEANLQQLTAVLSSSLYDLDELTASTQSLLTLLSKLISSLPANHISLFMDVRSVMSQMWAFTKHSTPSVRKAALRTIDTILDSLQSQAVPWFSELVKDGLWSLAECCILEPGHEIQLISVKVWSKFCGKTSQLALCEFCRHFFDDLMNLVAQPENVPFPPEAWKGFAKSMATSEEEKEVLKYIGGTPSPSRPDQCETRSEAVSRTRQNVTKMLGVLCGFVTHNYTQQQFIHQTATCVSHRLLTNINSRFALHRIVGCMVLFHWWESKVPVPDEIYSSLLNALNEDLYFNEISSLFIQVQSEIKTVLQLASQHIKSPLPLETKQVYSLEDALHLHSELNTLLQGSCAAIVDDSNKRLGSIAKEAQENNHALQRTVRSYLVLSLSSASYHAPANSFLSVLHLPKINPIIRPLMEGLKEEENKVHRNAIAQALTYLLDICRKREPCPNPKLVRNISLSLRGDETVTPDLMDPVAKVSDDILTHCKCDRQLAAYEAILSLVKKHASSLHITTNRRKNNNDNQYYSPGKENHEVARAGALACLQRICDHLRSDVFHALPQLWNLISEPLKQEDTPSNGNTTERQSVDKDAIDQKMMSLVITEAMVSVLEEDLVKNKVVDLLPSISNLIWSQYSAVRYVCSRCYAALTKRIPGQMMEKFITEILPNIESSELYNRMGVIEVIANLIDSLGPDVLPYSVILVVPLLGRMSDQDTQVRLVATRCFASLMQYLPVESSVPDTHKLSKELMSKRDRDRRFLEQLLDSSSLDEYPVPIPIHAKLRPYQEDGIKWMAFLNRYKLHGILCDDMGLGKTLQSICILASDHFLREQSYQETKNSSCAPLPSLVICPPTLTGHWVDEVEKFCDRKHLNPLHYVGTPSERTRLQAKLSYHNLVIASYEVVRNDISFFSQYSWNYCILDEGHIIRNAKNKLTVCVKSLRANHRLILTGTPIQNSVLELWSLFDFLMPGFLGSEQEFNFHYSKPILASRDVKSTSKEQEEGVMAMEALHKQVLPFMLRRMKEDVLQDLPPKIIQDYYCSLSPLQVRLYEDFSKTRAKREVDSSIARADAEQPQATRGSQTCHVFQALQYLQKVCNHPALVLTPCHPEYKRVTEDLMKENSSLHDIRHSSKLQALMQLLTDCGIGVSGDIGLDSIVGQHRALIFCQHKSMLDIVEHDLLRKHMPAVTFLRLDGSVAANNRHSIVSKFNNDPSIDLLLLTTKVGGLGLNLTGADTVIFIEHDWNPTVDMQAMDRAHRIGQKRVVNVYRLVTRGTLEEKIMSLQKFKINIANTVITADNSNVRSMETNQLLDLFTMNKNSGKDTKSSKEKSGKGFRAMIDEIGELWDQNQYDTEYNLDGFMEKLVS